MTQHAERLAVRFLASSPKKVTLFPFVARWSDGAREPRVTWEGAPQVRDGFARSLVKVWRAYTERLGIDPCWRVVWYPVDRNGYALVQLERELGRWSAKALLVGQPDVQAVGVDPFVFWFGAMRDLVHTTEAVTLSVAELSARAQRDLMEAWRVGEVGATTGAYTTVAAQMEALKIPGAEQLALPSAPPPTALGNLVMAWPHLSAQLRNQLSVVVAPDDSGVEVFAEPRAVCVYAPGFVSAGGGRPHPLDEGANVIAFSTGSRRVVPESGLEEDAPSRDEEWDEAMVSLSSSWERPRWAEDVATPDPLDAVLTEEDPLEAAVTEEDRAPCEVSQEELQEALRRLSSRSNPGLVPSRTASEQAVRDRPDVLKVSAWSGVQLVRGEAMRDGEAQEHELEFEVEVVGLESLGSELGEVVSLPDRLATMERERLAEESLGELALIGLSTSLQPVMEEPGADEGPELTSEERLKIAWGLERPVSPLLLWEGLCGGDAQRHLAQLVASIEASRLGDLPSDAFPIEVTLKGAPPSVERVQALASGRAVVPAHDLDGADVEHAGVALWCRPRRNIWAQVGKGGVGAGSGAVLAAPVAGSLLWPCLTEAVKGAVVVVSVSTLIEEPHEAAMELDNTLSAWLDLRREAQSPMVVAVVLSDLETLRDPKQRMFASQVQGTLGRIGARRESSADHRSLDDMRALGQVLLKALGLTWVQDRLSVAGVKSAIFALPQARPGPNHTTVHDLPLVWLLDQCRVRLNLARRSA